MRFSVEKNKTLAEQLDAAETGEQFGAVIQGLFGFLERVKDDEETQ